MSRISGGSMLRTRRRDANVKPNRRLDRKSSRGMIYENEELRLRTININAEVERGQSDIKKLRRENEQLRREIWSLREEYDRLDNLLRNGRPKGSDSESESEGDNQGESYSEDELEDQESAENDENAQKTRHKGLRVNFDHLSIVSEENTNSDSANAHEEHSRHSQDNSSPKYDGATEQTSESTTTGETVLLNGGWDFNNTPNQMPITEDVKNNYRTVDNGCQHHPSSRQTQETYTNGQHYSASTSTNPNSSVKHFFSPTPSMVQQTQEGTSSNIVCERGGPDVFVQNFQDISSTSTQPCKTVCSFQTGGNLEDLLMDIETTSNDAHFQPFHSENSYADSTNLTRYRSEINVFLQNPQDPCSTPPIIPEPMMLLPKLLPYIGFENLIDLPHLESPQVLSSNGSSCQVAPSSIMPTYVHVDTPIISPVIHSDTTKPLPTCNANETAQNAQNTEHMKTKSQSPATRRRLYAANNKLQQVNDRKVVVPPETYHAVRQRLGSISSSSDKTEQKTDSTKKSRRVSIFSGRKKSCADAKEIEKDSLSVSNESSQRRKSDSRRPPKINVSDGSRTKSGKSSGKGKSGHEFSGGHSSMYSTTQESCPEATTSHSERNSLASSRESSTSLSMRSHKSHRKLSTSSVHNGNIPWCGCWGNGCL